MRTLIGELGTERDRQILFRFYVAEHEKATICADLDLDLVHFNKVLFRAKQRFRTLLEKRRREPVSRRSTAGG